MGMVRVVVLVALGLAMSACCIVERIVEDWLAGGESVEPEVPDNADFAELLDATLDAQPDAGVDTDAQAFVDVGEIDEGLVDQPDAGVGDAQTPVTDVGLDSEVITPDSALGGDAGGFPRCAREECNGEDDDCDGRIDEVLSEQVACEAGAGLCARSGVLFCLNGEAVCSAPRGEPAGEICDFEDNDCDGNTDEGLGALCRLVTPALSMADEAPPHLCRLAGDGRVLCMGAEADGRLEAPADRFAAVATGANFTCGIRLADSAIDCWGNDANGQVQDRPVAGRFHEIAAGGRTACAIGDGGTVCWGRNLDGEAEPPPVALTDIEFGRRFACGLRVDPPRGVSCWGELPPSLRTTRPEWELAADATLLTVGDIHICILDGRGRPRCWGKGLFGETTPPPGEEFTDLVAGQMYTCGLHRDRGLRRDQTVACWGPMWPSQDRFIGLAAGASQMCGLTNRLQVVCSPERGFLEP